MPNIEGREGVLNVEDREGVLNVEGREGVEGLFFPLAINSCVDRAE